MAEYALTKVSGRTALMMGGRGFMLLIKSALPDLEVLALFPCLDTRSSAEAMMDAVVLMLKVLCESPPVPTISHWYSQSQ